MQSDRRGSGVDESLHEVDGVLHRTVQQTNLAGNGERGALDQLPHDLHVTNSSDAHTARDVRRLQQSRTHVSLHGKLLRTPHVDVDSRHVVLTTRQRHTTHIHHFCRRNRQLGSGNAQLQNQMILFLTSCLEHQVVLVVIEIDRSQNSWLWAENRVRTVFLTNTFCKFHRHYFLRKDSLAPSFAAQHPEREAVLQ